MCILNLVCLMIPAGLLLLLLDSDVSADGDFDRVVERSL